MVDNAGLLEGELINIFRQFFVLTGILLAAVVLFAQETPNPVQDFDWLAGPATGELEQVATIEVPEGYAFLGPEDTKKMMVNLGNLVSGSEIGMILSPEDWFVLFEFDEIGFVKDDEKDSLDADKLMESFLQGQKEANKLRRSKGLTELLISGWYKKPFYDQQTHNLQWCTKLHEKESTEEFANYNLRILGRRGVTRATLVADLNQLDTAVPATKEFLGGFGYVEGQRYSEFRKGDKVAKYGLTALVLGGAAAVAAKTGLLKYLWKFLVLGALAVSGFFKKLFGRNSPPSEP